MGVKTLEKCLRFAVEAHSGQEDRHGVPYIFHAIRVSNRCMLITQKQLALVHDCFEDGPLDLCKKMKEELPEELISSLALLTRDERYSYEDYIERICLSGDCDAMVVKIHDLADNCSLYRMDDKASKVITERYIPAYKKIQKALAKCGYTMDMPIV